MLQKRVRLFNKILYELCDELLDETNPMFNKIRDFSIIQKFNEEINQNKDTFLACDISSLDNVSVFKERNIVFPEKYHKSKELWKYLHNLYFISLENRDEELVKLSTNNISNLMEPEIRDITTNLFSNFGNLDIAQTLNNPMFQSLINDIASDFSEQLEGKDIKDINPNNLIADMMGSLTGSSSSTTGINFQNMIEKTKSKIAQEVKNGNISLPTPKNNKSKRKSKK